MRTQDWALGALTCLGLALPLSAAAQTPAGGGSREFKIGARATGTYDTNVSRSTKAVAAIRGLALDDYFVTPAATISVVQPLGRNSLFLAGDVGYAFYKRNTELNSERSSLSGGGSASLGPCQQNLVAAYSANQGQSTALDLGDVKNVQRSTTFGGTLQCATPLGAGVAIAAQRAEARNSDPTRKISDSTTDSASVSLVYGKPTLGVVSLSFSYAETNFPKRDALAGPIDDGFFTQNYALSYERAFNDRLSVSAAASRTFLKRAFAPPGVKQSITSNTYALDVTYGLGARINLDVHASRALTPSQQLGKTYDKQTSLSAGVSYRSSQRLAFTAGVSRNDVDSNVDSALVLGPVVTSSSTQAVYASATYSPGQLWSLSLNVRQEDRDANLPEFNYTSTRIGLTAQASF